MRNVFFVSLQRAGSNYVEVILNKNTEGLAFRGYLVDKGIMMSKHCFPKDINALKNAKIPQEDFIIVLKNPYMWVESVCWNTEMQKEIEEVLWYDEFMDYKVKEAGDLNGYNLNNLVNMYKDFYKKWFEFSKDNKIQIVRYEDFLYKDKAEEVCSNIVSEIGYGQVKSNFKLHYKPVRFSLNFTKEDFEYYKNEKPTKLSKSHIDTINKILGLDFIEELGYKAVA